MKSIQKHLAILNEIDEVKDYESSSLTALFPHEFGHSLGLYHVDEPWVWIKSMREQWNIQKMIKNKTNIMYGGGGVYLNDRTSTTITPEQMNLIIENYKFGRLNLG